MRRLFLSTAMVIGLSACQDGPDTKIAPCQIGAYSYEQVLDLLAEKYAGLTPENINQLALDLLPCVGSPDPKIRDQLVYQSYMGWLRNDMLNDETKIKLFENVMTILAGPASADGFARPFAALDMSEIARADRVQPYLSPAQRSVLVQATATYMQGITDYRGYDEAQGWRHGVAHTADLILQLCLNKNISDEQIETLRDALTTQIAPASGHAYIFGESERLARPVFYMARRGAFSQEDWDGWFAALAAPAPYAAWGDVYKSQAGLAKLHNTKAFLGAIYLNANETQNENMRMLLPGARAALINLP